MNKTALDNKNKLLKNMEKAQLNPTQLYDPIWIAVKGADLCLTKKYFPLFYHAHT